MRRRIALAVVVLLLLFSTMLVGIPITGAVVDTIYVDDDNTTGPWDGSPEHPYQFIQDGINNASVGAGFTVYVYAGTYIENIKVYKPINLIGENRDETIIDAHIDDTVISVSADEAAISGFTIQTSHDWALTGIEITANDVTLSENTITMNNYGIYVKTSTGATISSNTILQNGDGIYLFPNCESNVITDNDISSNTRTGVTINSYCNKNQVLDNTINSNEQMGIYLYMSNENTVQSNTISGNNDRGIYLFGSHDSDIRQNIITDNKYGISINSNDNTIVENTISDNTVYGIKIDVSDNFIYHNNLQNNNQHAYEESGLDNTWDNGYPSGGNYWDDYTGLDSDADGVGDTPYDIPSGDNQDQYPLMLPYGMISQLELDVPDTAQENAPFQATVTVNEIPIHEAQVDFSGTTYSTDTSGVATIQAPLVDQDTEMLITASKTKYDSDSAWVTILDVPESTEPQLQISTLSSVTEGKPFQVTITAEDQLIENVFVSFADESYTTDNNGVVSLLAPLVDSDEDYLITASKQGYQTSTDWIQVLNSEPTVNKGWIYGNVTNISGESIVGASVCVILSTDENSETSKCTFTDENGSYSTSVPTGTYTVKANNKGYITSLVSDIVIKADDYTELIFILEKEPGPSPVDDNLTESIENTIREKVFDEEIGAGIAVETDEQIISYYSDELNIELTSVEDNVSFTVGAEDDTSGTILVINIGENVLSDSDNIVVKYDGEEIDEFTDIEEFFNSQSAPSPGWIRFLTVKGLYLFVRVPSFSVHVVSIYSLEEVIEFLTGPIAVTLYIVFCIIGASAFFYPFVAWPSKIRRGKKK